MCVGIRDMGFYLFMKSMMMDSRYLSKKQKDFRDQVQIFLNKFNLPKIMRLRPVCVLVFKIQNSMFTNTENEKRESRLKVVLASFHEKQSNKFSQDQVQVLPQIERFD
jgi:hypothetical protein